MMIGSVFALAGRANASRHIASQCSLSCFSAFFQPSLQKHNYHDNHHEDYHPLGNDDYYAIIIKKSDNYQKK
jgi:hypothetical protein